MRRFVQIGEPSRQKVNYAMTENDQIDQVALSDEVSDEAVEVAGTRTENAAAWTWVCTGIGSNYVETPGLGKPGFKVGRGMALVGPTTG